MVYKLFNLNYLIFAKKLYAKRRKLEFRKIRIY